MLTLFRHIFQRNSRSVFILFLVLYLTGTGFLFIRELTENVTLLVSRETKPIFGSDIHVVPNSYTSTPLQELVASTLSGMTYTWWERTEFSTTLFDREGKTGLVNVVAYDGNYPQVWILRVTPPLSRSEHHYIAATPGLLTRFASGGMLDIDGKNIHITHTIIDSSDLGFSFWSENHLLIVPRQSLSGSSLISSGSRLTQRLLLSFPQGTNIANITILLKKSPRLRETSVMNYLERSERTLSMVDQLTDYILLILVVTALFWGIILRSSHDALFADLSRTLSIMETLGLTRRRQVILFGLFYLMIIPLSFLASILTASGLMSLVRLSENAVDFRFLISPLFFTIEVLICLIVASFLPAWSTKFRGWSKISIPWKIPRSMNIFLERISLLDSLSLILAIFAIVYLIFAQFLWSLDIVGIGILSFIILATLLILLYWWYHWIATRWRTTHFVRYDGVRTLLRPMMPTIPLTISLLGIMTFLIVFLLFTLSFRSRLVMDSKSSVNIYAINILDSDLLWLKRVLTGAEIHSILRARISKIDGVSLAEHLHTPNPTSEFTREFNITTDVLENPIVRGTKNLTKDDVSVDEDFSKRLWVDLGDHLEFLLSGKAITLRVANIRKSIRDGFRPFFFFSFQKEAFEKAPKTYFASDTTHDSEKWKKLVLSKSGSHVTFIDIENILLIAQNIAGKILAVISLFFLSILLFGFMAILSLFSRIVPLERVKSRLYSLFGLSRQDILVSLVTTRVSIVGVSYILSGVLGTTLFLWILRSSEFLTFDLVSWILTLSFTSILSLITLYLVRPR